MCTQNPIPWMAICKPVSVIGLQTMSRCAMPIHWKKLSILSANYTTKNELKETLQKPGLILTGYVFARIIDPNRQLPIDLSTPHIPSKKALNSFESSAFLFIQPCRCRTSFSSTYPGRTRRWTSPCPAPRKSASSRTGPRVRRGDRLRCGSDRPADMPAVPG